MADRFEWIPVHKDGFKGGPIGAIGFIGNDAAVILAFYDDNDGNRDGRVSNLEKVAAMVFPVKLKGGALVEVAMTARGDPDIILRDTGFDLAAKNLYLNFAAGLVIDAVFAVYFKRPVAMAGKGIAARITSSMIKGYVIRKGFEKAAQEAFKAATGR